jgi:hypothetical protein
VLISDDLTIVAGHGRVLAAQKLGLDEVPCIRLSHLSENQRRAYVIADNRLAEVGASWDLEMLQLELESFDHLEFDPAVFEFDKLFKESEEEIEETEGYADDSESGVTDDNYKSQYGVLVECSDSQDQEGVYNELVKLGYKCRILTV